MGPSKEIIQYKNIRTLRLCKNLMPAMAWSTQRIEIKQYHKGYIMGTTYISPQNREIFYDELTKQCKNHLEIKLKAPLIVGLIVVN